MKRGSRVIKLFIKTTQKQSAQLSIGGPHGISEKGCPGYRLIGLLWHPPPIIYLLRMWAMIWALIYLP